MLFAVTRERGPAWDGSRPMREQDGWTAHAAFMDGLASDGVVVIGGPVGEGERRFLFLVDAPTEEAIRDRLATDPWTPTGQLVIASIEPWTILLGRPPSWR